jgi:hypothetical protein
MSARQNCNPGAHGRIARLVALVSFLLVLLGGTNEAHAARPPAPMCAPDAQSMPAPLQRTATSDAEIVRGACPSAQGPSWSVLPDYPSRPINWYQFVGDPLWLGETSLRAPKAAAVTLKPDQPLQAENGGFAGDVFRPPRFEIGK